MIVCAASNNAGKLKELRRILERMGHEVKSLRELGITLDPEETGTTFAENARIKAEAFCKASGLPTVADDSGLCTDALNGAPGVYSARYCGHHGDDEAHAHDSIQEDEHHILGVEPHIWSSAYNAQIIAGNIVNALCTIDKNNEETYMERYKNLCNQIEHTDSLICHMLSAPNADRAFMIYHPALSYFARDYGLHQISIEEDGKEPSPSHLKNLIDTCKEEKVRVIFVQPEFDRRNAEIIAKQTGTKVVPINPLSYDWEEEMLNIARELVVKK